MRTSCARKEEEEEKVRMKICTSVSKLENKKQKGTSGGENVQRGSL